MASSGRGKIATLKARVPPAANNAANTRALRTGLVFDPSIVIAGAAASVRRRASLIPQISAFSDQT